MNNAYMIRSDGKAFPVTVHLYGAPDDIEETLFAAEWLYGHTQFPSVKTLIEKFIAAYAVSLDPVIKEEDLSEEIVPTILYELKGLGYRVLSEGFVRSLNTDDINLSGLQSVEMLNAMVNRELNQEFLRARFGGMFDSDGDGVMYFRISSTGFNWFPIIWEFVYNYQNSISGVTIVKDPESTGQNGYYYKIGGQAVNNMPVADFLTASGRPVMDSSPRKSLYDSYPEMNRTRLSEKLKRKAIKELMTDYVFIKEFK